MHQRGEKTTRHEIVEYVVMLVVVLVMVVIPALLVKPGDEVPFTIPRPVAAN